MSAYINETQILFLSSLVWDMCRYVQGICRSTYYVWTGVAVRQNSTSLVCGHDEIWDDGDSLDFRCPGELDMMSNAMGRLGRLLSSIDTSCWCGQDLGDGDFSSGDVLWRQWLQIGSNEASKQRSTNIIRMSLCDDKHMLVPGMME